MLNYHLDAVRGILILSPDEPLSAQDFAALSATIDPYIAHHGALVGLLIHTHAFPGWTNLEAALAHMRFVESHHQKIQRIAVVSDSVWLTEIPKIASHLVHPEIRHFSESEYDSAVQWLEEAYREVV